MREGNQSRDQAVTALSMQVESLRNELARSNAQRDAISKLSDLSPRKLERLEKLLRRLDEDDFETQEDVEDIEKEKEEILRESEAKWKAEDEAEAKEHPLIHKVKKERLKRALESMNKPEPHSD